MGHLDKKPDEDVIDVMTLEQEDINQWLTIDDVVGILGKGDRTIRRFIVEYNWMIRHMKDNGKIKTFIFKEDINRFLGNRGAKKETEEETPKPPTQSLVSDIPDDRALFTAMRKLNSELAMTLPDLVKKYQENTLQAQELQQTISEVRSKKAVWMTVSICVGIFAILSGGYLFNQLSERESAIIKSTASLEDLRQERLKLINQVHTSEKEILSTQARIRLLEAQLAGFSDQKSQEGLDTLSTGFQSIRGGLK